MDKSKFRETVLKLNSTRNHSINNSLGVYDAYKYIRKNKWFDIGISLKEHDFYSIIRLINKYLSEEFILGNDIVLPLKLGRLELRKYNSKIYFDGNKLKTNLPVDWNRTLNLWSEDEETYKKRFLVKMEEKEIFKVFYNKRTANYKNKCFYSFRINRDLKRKLKASIKEGITDAFKLNG